MKYVVKYDFDLLNTLFLKGDTLYIGRGERRVSGSTVSTRNVFNGNKDFLGSISDKYFETFNNHLVERVY